MDARKTIVWNMANSSKTTSLECTLTQTYTATTEIQIGVQIGAKASLEKAFEATAGVSISYKYTESASTQYGTKLTLKPKTAGKIEANSYCTCYVFREVYRILGVDVKEGPLVGVFKPTGVHWYYSETTVN